MSLKVILAICMLVVSCCEVGAKLKGDDCEGTEISSEDQDQGVPINYFFPAVCVQFLTKFSGRLKENDVPSNPDSIEMELLKACKEAKGKDDRFVSDVCKYWHNYYSHLFLVLLYWSKRYISNKVGEQCHKATFIQQAR